jgi:hypothetical protein
VKYLFRNYGQGRSPSPGLLERYISSFACFEKRSCYLPYVTVAIRFILDVEITFQGSTILALLG